MTNVAKHLLHHNKINHLLNLLDNEKLTDCINPIKAVLGSYIKNIAQFNKSVELILEERQKIYGDPVEFCRICDDFINSQYVIVRKKQKHMFLKNMIHMKLLRLLNIHTITDDCDTLKDIYGYLKILSLCKRPVTKPKTNNSGK